MARDKDNYNEWFRGYYQTHKEQYKAKAEKRQTEMRAWFEDKFASILFCCKCGEKERCCLDFHHINPKEKEYQIARIIKTHSKETIEKEVSKCIVVCSNCHRKIHASLM